MANHIRDVHVVNHRLDPHETELRIHVELDELTPTTQIKGRLMGPRNVYASTVEVAYPMREVERGTAVVLRVVIPEPSWWEPKTPFLYQGPLELWRDGQVCERREISHGIHNLQLKPKGLHLNGKPIVLRGKTVEPNITEADAKALHDDGVSLILSRWSESLANLADRHGLFVLEHSGEPPGRVHGRHPSEFGGFFSKDSLGYVVELAEGRQTRRGCFEFGPLDQFPEACQGPKILLVPRLPDPLPARPDVIGWIESA